MKRRSRAIDDDSDYNDTDDEYNEIEEDYDINGNDINNEYDDDDDDDDDDDEKVDNIHNDDDDEEDDDENDDDSIWEDANLELKPNHKALPLYVTSKRVVYLEAFGPLYKEASAFLVSIAAPVSRLRCIHEYVINNHTLFSAMSIGKTAAQIIGRLRYYAKTTTLPQAVEDFIEERSNYGTLRGFLEGARYTVRTRDKRVLDTLYRDPQISSYCCRGQATTQPQGVYKAPQDESVLWKNYDDDDDEDDDDYSWKIDTENEGSGDDDDDDDSDFSEAQTIPDMYCLDFLPESVTLVKERLYQLMYPVIEEYFFTEDNDGSTPPLQIGLKPGVTIRPYQKDALMKMFRGGRAHSGIIVLPCGAGKTLTAIAACCTIKKSCLVLCDKNVSVDQWRAEFKRWTDIDDSQITLFTSDEMKFFNRDAPLVISNYSILTKESKGPSEQIRDYIRNKTWGLIILDEAHCAPAKTLSEGIARLKSHCKLGLTATLVREDAKINNLNYLIGPKLYEANWSDLVGRGFLANVRCIEVQCGMAECFMQEYIREHTVQEEQLLSALNPTKINCCEYLVRLHEMRGDKIIIFTDYNKTVDVYHETLGRPFISGATKQADRLKLLEAFKTGSSLNTLIVSRVGDTSIDLPDANVIIQLSSHFGSRRQEAQRLGRILRKKSTQSSSSASDVNAIFYTLVSLDTTEMFYAAKRQRFLNDQGYSYKVISNAIEKYREKFPQRSQLHYTTEESQRELLVDILGPSAIVVPRRHPSGSLLAKARKVSMSEFAGSNGYYDEFKNAN